MRTGYLVTNDVIVYRATNRVNNKCYVGVTKRGLSRRRHEHLKAALAEKPAGLLHRAIKKYGPENFSFEAIFDFQGDYELAMIYEGELVEKEKPAYNLIPGGRNRVGPLHPETLAKMRASHVGKPSGRKGQKMPPEIVARLKARVRTPEERERMRQGQLTRRPARVGAGSRWVKKYATDEDRKVARRAQMLANEGLFKGRRHTPEARAQMSEAGKGRAGFWAGKTRPGYQRNTPVICVTDGKRFGSLAEAERFYGLYRGAVSVSVRKNVPVNGLQFTYEAPKSP